MQLTVNSFGIPNQRFSGSVAYLRYYAQDYFVNVDGEPVVPSALDSKDWYQQVSCTVSGNIVTVPQHITDTTTDSQTNPDARVAVALYDANNVRRAVLLTDAEIPHNIGNPVDFEEIVKHNSVYLYSRKDTNYLSDLIRSLIGDVINDIVAGLVDNAPKTASIVFVTNSTTPPTGQVLAANSAGGLIKPLYLIGTEGETFDFTFHKTLADAQNNVNDVLSMQGFVGNNVSQAFDGGMPADIYSPTGLFFRVVCSTDSNAIAMTFGYYKYRGSS